MSEYHYAMIADMVAHVWLTSLQVCCCGCCRRKDKNKVENMQQSSARGRKSPEAWKEQYNRAQQGTQSTDAIFYS